MSLKHKHFIGIPVFLFLIWTTLWSAGSALRSDVSSIAPAAGEIVARGANKEFFLPRGVYGLLQEDGMLHDDGVELSLRDGTVLVASEGMARVRIGNISVSGFHGGFLASRTAGSQLNIFALTTPVLLQRDEFSLVVPVGMRGEWTADALPTMFDLQAAADARASLDVLDSEVAREERRALSQIRPISLPSFNDGAGFRTPWASFIIPAADDLVRKQNDRARLMRLRDTLQSGDLAQSRAQLEDDDVRQLLRSDDLSPAVFQTLLANSVGLPSVAKDLLTETRDRDLWLLASFHPDFVSAAWETPGPVMMSRQSRLLRWMQLPSSDVGVAVPERVVNRWTAQLSRHLGAAEPSERSEFIHALLSTMRDYRTFVGSGEFPERLQRHADALRLIVEPFATELTAEDIALYAPWRTVNAVSSYIEPPSAAAITPNPEPDMDIERSQAESGTDASGKSAATFDAAKIEARTRQMLIAIGALFTVQTAVHAENASRVTVQNLLFFSSNGEHAYDFTFDTGNSAVRDIHRDGEPLPYALTLEAFEKWVGGR